MTAHPIDADRLRSLSRDVREGGSYLADEEEWFVAGEVSALLDALAAAEHRATRAEDQSEARRINTEYWQGVARANATSSDVWKESAEEARARIKAVRDVHYPEEYGGGVMCTHCPDGDGVHHEEWPCPTILAMDGENGGG